MHIEEARKVLKIEAEAVSALSKKVGDNFNKAIRILAKCRGRVIVTGMGKGGIIGQKISATLSSTGTPSLFLHSAEAIHGDLGRVTKEDVVLAISNSGETEEVIRLLPLIKKIGARLIALTGNTRSNLAKHSDVVLDVSVRQEACPLGLAPTASTTATLAMGDALALTLLKKKGFREEDFAQLHPGGNLGRKLLKVKDLMRTGRQVPVVREETLIQKALFAITRARAGSCVVVNGSRKLVGIFTDGDLRRRLREKGEKILLRPIREFATLKPLVIHEDRLAAEALHLIREKKIDELPVVDRRGRAVGLLDIQDLLKAGFV